MNRQSGRLTCQYRVHDHHDDRIQCNSDGDVHEPILQLKQLCLRLPTEQPFDIAGR